MLFEMRLSNQPLGQTGPPVREKLLVPLSIGCAKGQSGRAAHSRVEEKKKKQPDDELNLLLILLNCALLPKLSEEDSL